MPEPAAMITAERVATIATHYPDAERIRWIGIGTFNTVAVVEDEVCFRFPRVPVEAGQLRTEYTVLGLIDRNMTVPTPRPIFLADDDSYAITSCIAGSNRTSYEIQTQSVERQQGIGRSLGQFILELNGAIEPATLRELRRGRADTHDWQDWYDETLGQAAGTPFDKAYRHYHRLHARGQATAKSRLPIVIHDDLHPDNVLFDETFALSGVIDFGDTWLADIHRELRSIYRTGGPVVLESLLDVSASYFDSVDPAYVRNWAVMHEIGVLIEALHQTKPNERRVGMARDLLKLWLGEDWVTTSNRTRQIAG